MPRYCFTFCLLLLPLSPSLYSGGGVEGMGCLDLERVDHVLQGLVQVERSQLCESSQNSLQT